MNKPCTVCKLPRAEAKERGIEFDSTRNICKPCKAKRIKIYHLANKERLKVYAKTYYNDNIEKIRAYHQLPTSKSRQAQRTVACPENFIGILVCYIKSRYKDITYCDLDKEFILNLYYSQNGECAITKMKMTHNRRCPRQISVDRIDSHVGYLKNNVQLVCRWVNHAKNSMNNEEFMQLLSDALKTMLVL